MSVAAVFAGAAVDMGQARNAPRAAETLTGIATIIDGDTLRIGDVHIRLWGIDAPESGQTCHGEVPGNAATAVLVERTDGKTLVCTGKGEDRFGRTVAACSVGGDDLGKFLVRSGWAWDFPRYSKGAYSDVEQEAASAHRGVHAMTCEKPWNWRRSHPR